MSVSVGLAVVGWLVVLGILVLWWRARASRSLTEAANDLDAMDSLAASEPRLLVPLADQEQFAEQFVTLGRFQREIGELSSEVKGLRALGDQRFAQLTGSMGTMGKAARKEELADLREQLLQSVRRPVQAEAVVVHEGDAPRRRLIPRGG